jgi:hypothetical protein
MDWDERAQRVHDEESLAWSGRFNNTKLTDSIAEWDFSCELVENR